MLGRTTPELWRALAATLSSCTANEQLVCEWRRVLVELTTMVNAAQREPTTAPPGTADTQLAAGSGSGRSTGVGLADKAGVVSGGGTLTEAPVLSCADRVDQVRLRWHVAG